MSISSVRVAIVGYRGNAGNRFDSGASISKRLVKDGFHVVASYVSDDKTANQLKWRQNTDLAISLQAQNLTVSTHYLTFVREQIIKTDIRLIENVQSLAHQSAALGTVTFLCLNAATCHLSLLDGITPENYDDTFGTNFKGHLFLTQAVVPHMPASSSIVAISSSATRMTNVPSNLLVYAATKGAIEQAMQVLAKELAPKQIRVNTIFWDTLSPAGRVGEPDEVAGVVSFFAGPDSRWVSGQVLGVDGAGTIG
ncbi:NAD(P)-binding protein [Ceratobasidium sp. AG-I]|nr:NAD(P)-binding protein [Ceratobasidium sp. AG-I]